MSVKSKNEVAKKIWVNLLIAIPITLGMITVIKNKWEIVFWIYLGIGTISALITRWYGFDNEKSKFLKIVEKIFWVSALSFFLLGIWLYLLDKKQ